LLRGRRPVRFLEAESVDAHAQPAELHVHIGQPGQGLHGGLPALEYLGMPAFIGADARHAPAVVDDHGRLRKGQCQVQQLRQLRKKQPGIEGKPQRRQLRHALPVGPVQQQALRRGGQGIDQGTVRVPGRQVPDATKAPLAGLQMGQQHLAHRRTGAQVRISDDALRKGTGRMALPVLLHVLHALRRLHHELGLAHRLHRLRAGSAVARQRLHVDRGTDPVARARVGQVLVRQVAPARSIVEMVVGIDDGQRWLKDLLLVQAQPIRPHR